MTAESGPDSVPFCIQALRLGARSSTPFTLVALGTEPSIQYGLNLEKKLRPANTIVIGYANALASYLTTAQELKEGGFEPNCWGGKYRPKQNGSYAPEAEGVVLQAAEELARPKS